MYPVCFDVFVDVKMYTLNIFTLKACDAVGMEYITMGRGQGLGDKA